MYGLCNLEVLECQEPHRLKPSGPTRLEVAIKFLAARTFYFPGHCLHRPDTGFAWLRAIRSLPWFFPALRSEATARSPTPVLRLPFSGPPGLVPAEGALNGGPPALRSGALRTAVEERDFERCCCGLLIRKRVPADPLGSTCHSTLTSL